MVIYNTLGQPVQTLLDGRYVPAGRRTVIWDGRDAAGREVPSGVYFARLHAGTMTHVRKLLLLK